jgi:hypothetical protein
LFAKGSNDFPLGSDNGVLQLTTTRRPASLRGHLKGHAGKEQAGSQSYIPPL